jgi:hypothetical protein
MAPAGGARYGGTRGGRNRKNTVMIAAFAGVLVLGVILALLFIFHVIPTSAGEEKTAGGAEVTAEPVFTSATAMPTAEPSETAAETESAVPEKEYVEGVSNDELLDYFCEIGLHIEYGTGDEILKRWEGPIRITVKGDYTEEDYKTLEKHIDMLNGLNVLPDISIADLDANFFVYFIPLDEMDDMIPGYEEGNWGYFNLGWDWDYIAKQAYIGIATDVTTQGDRNHLILEEVTQALGLMNDSPDYQDSIFQVNWTDTQELSDIDIALIRMMYCDELKPGMKLPEVREIMGE